MKRYPKDVEIGFELEFGHDIPKQDVIQIISDKFPNIAWGNGKHKFNLVNDGSVWTKRKRDSELITPAWSAREAVDNLKILFDTMREMDTTTDKTTGIHINIGWKDAGEVDNISPLKVLVYSNEEKWLKHFDRENNQWCRAYQIPVSTAASRIIYNDNFVDRIENVIYNLGNTNRRFIDFGKCYYGYVEFRGIGGANYHKKYKSVVAALDNFVYALDISRYEDLPDYRRKLKSYMLGVL